MFSSFELLTAYRFLKSKRKERFISLITFIAIGGIAVGVIALIVVTSVMKGFQHNLKEKILGINAHILVQNLSDGIIASYESVQRKIEGVHGVKAAAPFVYGQVIVASKKKVIGVGVKGVIPKDEERASRLQGFMTNGASLKQLQQAEDQGLRGAIIGNELAASLGLRKGSVFSIILPSGRLTPAGMIPRLKKFTVVGIFKSGMYEYDSTLLFIHLHQAQRFFRLGTAINGFAVMTNNMDTIQQTATTLTKKLGFPFIARDWVSLNKNLFSALKLERIAMFIILILIVIVAAFNIISTLLMTTMEKQSSIAILKAMGARQEQIMKIFVLDGFAIGLIGTAIGGICGVAITMLLEHYHFISLPMDVYQVDTLPIILEWGNVTIILVSALLISLLSTLYPSWSASRLEPVEALRYG